MNGALWRLQDVTLPGRAGPRLERMTLEIPGGVCAVAGPSGAGKTSLLNLLVEFERPGAGRIERLLPGAALAAPGEVRRLPVYWCPPDGGLWPHLSVREHLETVSPRGSDSPWSLELLAAFELEHLAAVRPDSLSAGEQSRLSVARALASGARVLVMDEPLAHVNRSLARSCWQAVRAMCAERGTSLIFSSHDAETILREAEQVICLDRGRAVWCGRTLDLYERPPSRELAEFLGPVNWFESAEAAEWLGVTASAACGVRPERLDVTPSADGRLVVERELAAGPVSEVELREESSGHQRRFVRATGGKRLSRGMRVALSAVLSSLLAVWVAGCGSSAEGKTLPLTGTRVWSLPVEGDRLPAPRAVTFNPQGELFVLDDVGRVVVYGADGQFSRSWWMPEYSIGRPEGIIVLRDGRLAIADTHYHRVVFFSQTGELLGTFGERGEGPGQFIYPCDVAEDDQGHLYVAEYGGHDRVQKFTKDLQFVLEFGSAGTAPGQLQRTGGIAWHEGVVYVCDIINNRVQSFRDDGTFVGILALSDGRDVEYPYDLAVAGDGRIAIIEYKAGRVAQATQTGELQGRYGRTGRGTGEFWTPWGLTQAADGRIIVADTGNRRIVELTP